MIEWDHVAATLVGVVTGAAPFTIRALWRFCEKRSDQQHERAMKQLDNQEKMVRRGMDRGYEFRYDERTGDFYPRLSSRSRNVARGINRDVQDRPG